MKKLWWLLSIYILFTPLFVAFAQISILHFPTEDYFFAGVPYSPYPQVFYFPILAGIFLMILSISITFLLRSKWYGKISFVFKLLIFISLITINGVLFWFGINLSQRGVILEYLSAINANGLHFLRIFMLPIMPEVFPKGGVFPYHVAIVLGVIGLAGMLTQYIILFNRKI